MQEIRQKQLVVMLNALLRRYVEGDVEGFRVRPSLCAFNFFCCVVAAAPVDGTASACPLSHAQRNPSAMSCFVCKICFGSIRLYQE